MCEAWLRDGRGMEPKVIVRAWKCHRGRAVVVEVDESLESSHTTSHRGSHHILSVVSARNIARTRRS